MIKHGAAPYLECSSKGDKRFSAYYAKLRKYEWKSIEQIFQSSKLFNGKPARIWQEAKGRRADNDEEVRRLYSRLWDEYIEENPELLQVIKTVPGVSDVFGQSGHACQATELWRIRNETNLCRIGSS